MLDFVQIKTKTSTKGDGITVFPKFLVRHSNDLMIRGGKFYAVWDEENSIWSKDPMRVATIVDAELLDRASKYPPGTTVGTMLMTDFTTKKWSEFQSYLKDLPDSYKMLDSKVCFKSDAVKREDYISKRLPYDMDRKTPKAWHELLSTLYSEDNRDKIEWFIGSVIAGDSRWIQKFAVFYGDSGTGKSTIIEIIQKLFDGYWNVFNSEDLGSRNASFALESFSENPLVSIQHDGDLSKIEDNTRINSIASHETMLVNEKNKKKYAMRFQSLLIMGTNKPVRITDMKSGIIRRLVVIFPTGKTIPTKRYTELMSNINFELGSIAWECLTFYKSKGAHYYDAYKPMEMLDETNDFYDFMSESYPVFASQESTTLSQAWEMYKAYADEANLKYPMPRRAVKNELRNYFMSYDERAHVNGKLCRNVYSGFRRDRFGALPKEDGSHREEPWYSMKIQDSVLDTVLAGAPAQLATAKGYPSKKWADCSTKLADIDTTKLHYVKVPENLIVIDFDIPGDNGEKDLAKNIEMASKWPETYAEASKSGKGVHLHYYWKGGPISDLRALYDDHIEVKVYTGDSSLRRKLTICNNSPIAELSEGLPLKDKKGTGMVDFKAVKDEQHLRRLVLKNLKKEVHPGTKPSVDFIKKILDEAYESGMHYDVNDMRSAVFDFASRSTHHSRYCMGLVEKMHFCSKDVSDGVSYSEGDRNVFFDCEVFPNLFVVVYKPEDGECVRMIDPSPQDIEQLVKMKLIGFNNLRYDNHILYARLIGYSDQKLYELSKAIIGGARGAGFRQARNLAYADIYDFSSKKQSLKKFEIELGIHHQELGLDWDKPVPADMFEVVADYCCNDVEATEATFKDRKGDFEARELLAELSGLSVAHTTREHVTRIMFGNDRHPQSQFVYTDLSTEFPGYKFENGRSTYMGEDPSEGGYVYSEPGIYNDVALLDVESLHPHSIIALNLFGDKYTKRFADILEARLAVKHHDYEKAKGLLDGKLEKFLSTDSDADKLQKALKIVINSVYGLTKATFDCEFRDPRNVDNIVAKRGALFMITLKHEVQKRGFTVAHIKTDSIKIPNATQDIVDFCMEFGRKYGYTFDHEATFERFCLVDRANYVCKVKEGKENGAGPGEWSATGSKFQRPYIFKPLFLKSECDFEDYCETKQVSGSAHIELNIGTEDHPDMRFVGHVGSFVPVSHGGGIMLRVDGEKKGAVSGTKGYRWEEAETLRASGQEGNVDTSYFKKQQQEAVDAIERFGSYEEFVKE